MKHLQERITTIRKQIEPAKLMVVTKRRSVELIQEVIDAGVKILGENTLQEIQKKYDLSLCRQLKRKGVELHFIGHLQKNKVDKVVRYCDAVQSVDSIALAEKISQAAQKLKKTIKIFFELNLTHEVQKYGFREDKIAEAMSYVRSLPSIEPVGVMTMGKQGDEKLTRKVFHACRSIADDLNLPEVSMGMSADHLIARDEGATIIRLGSMVFL